MFKSKLSAKYSIQRDSNMRISLLALPFDQRKISINGELVIDYTQGRFYINKDNEIIELSRGEIVDSINNAINEVFDIDISTVNFTTLINNINEINKWITSRTTPGTKITSFDQLNTFLSGMDSLGFTIKNVLDNKVKYKSGMKLSDNNFSDDDKDKLDSIGYGATTYIHPQQYQCEINRGVYKLNGYPDPGEIKNIKLTPFDIGLGNPDPEANFYKHPTQKICDATMIESVNGMHGDVEITKAGIGLPDIENMALSDSKNYTSESHYAVPAIIENYLSQLESTRADKGTDSYISKYTKILIKNTVNGQTNEIYYSDTTTNISIKTSLNIFIEDLYFLEDGNELMVLSDGVLKTYRFNGIMFEDVDIFDGVNGYNAITISNGIIKSLIEPKNYVYGVVMTNSNGSDFIYTWGRIIQKTLPNKYGIEKVEIVNDIIYILLDTGKIIYEEFLDKAIPTSYYNLIHTYNDIIDLYVRNDFLIAVRSGTREVIVAGEDSTNNFNIPSKIRNSQPISYRTYVYDDLVCVLTIDNKIRTFGKSMDKLASYKPQFPIDKISIYDNKIILIDERDNIIDMT